MLPNQGLDHTKVLLLQSMADRELDPRLQPELRLAAGKLRRNVYPRFSAREEVEAKALGAK